MKNNHLKSFTFLLVFLLFASCSNFFENPDSISSQGDETALAVQNQASAVKRKIEVSGDIETEGAVPVEVKEILESSQKSSDSDAFSRTALPNLPSNVFYKVIAVNKADSSNTVEYAGTSSSYKISLEEGTWTLTAYVYNCTTAAAATADTLLLQSDADEITLNAETNHLSSHGITTKPAKTGSGTANLEINAANECGLHGCKAVWSENGEEKSQIMTYYSNVGDPLFTFNFNSSSVAAGSYDVKFYFYQEQNASDIASAVELYCCTETINIFNTLSTTLWQTSYSSAYISGTPAVFTITKACILVYSQSEFYVNPDAATAGKFGTKYDPLLTVDAAISLITKYQKDNATILLKAGTTHTMTGIFSDKNISLKSYDQADTTDITQNPVIVTKRSQLGYICLYGDYQMNFTNITFNCSSGSISPLCIQSSSSTTSNGKIEMNYCKIYNTKAIYALQIYDGTLNLNNCYLESSSTSSSSSVICVNDPTVSTKSLRLNVKDCTIRHATKTMYGIRISGSGTTNADSVITMENTTVTNNGYGFYIDTVTPKTAQSVIKNCTISGNNTGFYFGLTSSMNLKFDGTEITGNSYGINNLSTKSTTSIVYKDVNVHDNTTSGISECSHFYLEGSCTFSDSNPLVLNFITTNTYLPLIITDEELTGNINISIPKAYYLTTTQVLSGSKVSENSSFVKPDRSAWQVSSTGYLEVRPDADTIYIADSVTGGGDDTNGDGSSAKPYASLKRAVEQCKDETMDWKILLKTDLNYHSEDAESTSYYCKIVTYSNPNLEGKSLTIKSDTDGTRRLIDFESGYSGYFVDCENTSSSTSFTINFQDLQFKEMKGCILYFKGSGVLTANINNCLFGEELTTNSNWSNTNTTSNAMVNFSGSGNLNIKDSIFQHNSGYLICHTSGNDTMENTKILYNYLNGYYFLRFANNSSYMPALTITNSSITNNKVTGYNSSSVVTNYTYALLSSLTKLNGAVIIKDNVDTSGNQRNMFNNLYTIQVGSALTGSDIYLTSREADADSEYKFTTGYSTYNGTTVPSTYFHYEDSDYKITWDSTSKEGAIVSAVTNAGSSYFAVQNDMTFQISKIKASASAATDFDFTVTKDYGTATAADLTSAISASDWTFKAYCNGKDITSDTFITVTNTDGTPPVRRITIGSGVTPGTVIQLYAAVNYNGIGYGGTFEIPVVSE